MRYTEVSTTKRYFSWTVATNRYGYDEPSNERMCWENISNGMSSNVVILWLLLMLLLITTILSSDDDSIDCNGGTVENQWSSFMAAKIITAVSIVSFHAFAGVACRNDGHHHHHPFKRRVQICYRCSCCGCFHSNDPIRFFIVRLSCLSTTWSE
jgi:hypothetical protein